MAWLQPHMVDCPYGQHVSKEKEKGGVGGGMQGLDLDRLYRGIKHDELIEDLDAEPDISGSGAQVSGSTALVSENSAERSLDPTLPSSNTAGRISDEMEQHHADEGRSSDVIEEAGSGMLVEEGRGEERGSLDPLVPVLRRYQVALAPCIPTLVLRVCAPRICYASATRPAHVQRVCPTHVLRDAQYYPRRCLVAFFRIFYACAVVLTAAGPAYTRAMRCPVPS
eukprot:1833681-Rhodomonas_salina.2